MSTGPSNPLGPDRREAKDLSRELAVDLADKPSTLDWKAPGTLSAAIRKYLLKAAATLGYQAKWNRDQLQLSRGA